MSIYISGNKILHHPERLSSWICGENIAPISVQLQITNNCNQNCYYCVTEQRRNDNTMKLDEAYAIIDKLKSINVKGINITGGGEPTLSPHLVNIIEYISNNGIEIGLESNGVCIDNNMAEIIIKHNKWIRLSLDSIDSVVYNDIRAASDINKVISNISLLVNLKLKHKSTTTIGAQIVVTKFNYKDIYKTAECLRKLNIDYLYIRPLENEMYDKEEYNDIELEVYNAKAKYETIGFDVIVSDKWNHIKAYLLGQTMSSSDCLCYPFIGAIDVFGNIYLCCHMSHLDNRQLYCYGNLLTDDMIDLLEKRKSIAKNISSEHCPSICRGTSMNTLLNSIKKPSGHINFL